MSRYEHAALRHMDNLDIPSGEVTEVSAAGITIAGTFRPGAAVTLHPGARVYVLTADDVIELVRHPA